MYQPQSKIALAEKRSTSRQGFGQVMGPAEAGAEAEECLATSSEMQGVTGACFDRLKCAEPNLQAKEAEARARLMTEIERRQ